MTLPRVRRHELAWKSETLSRTAPILRHLSYWKNTCMQGCTVVRADFRNRRMSRSPDAFLFTFLLEQVSHIHPPSQTIVERVQ